MNINLHIERLVLDGLDIAPEQRPALQTAVEGELSRLLTERGLSPGLAQGTAVPRIATGGIQLTNNSPTQIGQYIAQSVYGGIGHE